MYYCHFPTTENCKQQPENQQIWVRSAMQTPVLWAVPSHKEFGFAEDTRGIGIFVKKCAVYWSWKQYNNNENKHGHDEKQTKAAQVSAWV